MLCAKLNWKCCKNLNLSILIIGLRLFLLVTGCRWGFEMSHSSVNLSPDDWKPADFVRTEVSQNVFVC